jgi:arylsulfatase A-like enzyme
MMNSNYHFLVLLLILACSIVTDQPPAMQQGTDTDLPNVVLLLADDMGIGDLACYNPSSKIPTPHMDTLAAEGAMFTNTHAASSVCTPSRYGLLTGRYAWRTRLKQGALGPFDPLLVDTSRFTLADLFKKKGYSTAIIGKWHLGLTHQDSIDYFGRLFPGPLELGFDHFFGINASLNMSPHCFIENHHTVGRPDVPVPEDLFSNHGSMTMTAGWRHEAVGPRLTREALTWMDQHLAAYPQQPFFLYLPTSAPHRPCVPPDFIRGRSRAGVRGDMVAEVDWALGEVVGFLKEKGIYDNTIIIVSSDNGAINGNKALSPDDSLETNTVFDHQSNAHWRGYKTQVWEGGHRVPMLLRWPGLTSKSTRSNMLFCLNDWLATFATFFGEELPDTAAEDSFNMLPALQGKKPERQALVSHSMWGQFAITHQEWKLILNEGSGGWGDSRQGNYPPGQLYHLAKDSLEQHNLYHEQPGKVAELEALLRRYQQEGRSRFE